MSIRTSPCDWPILYTSASSCAPPPSGSEDDDPMTPEDRALFERMAIDYLWRWSGRGFGTCPVTVRPCRGPESQSPLYGGFSRWEPVIINGNWFNIGCGFCGERCSCNAVSQIDLPGPINHVDKIVIGGEELDPSTYRVDNFRTLVRTDGGSWPLWNDAGASSGDAGVWEVTYSRGVPVPEGGQVAAGILACEFWKAANNDSSCQLPKRLSSITRQGVSLAILDNFDDIDTGHTGIWLIDSWLASVTKVVPSARVYSPDLPRRRRSTWP